MIDDVWVFLLARCHEVLFYNEREEIHSRNKKKNGTKLIFRSRYEKNSSWNKGTLSEILNEY